MRYEVDSYTLEYVEDEDKYYISFRDSVEQDCRIEIDKDIFDTYTNSKKTYIKIKNETSRHLEQSDLTEEDMYKRAFEPVESVEETVIKNIEKEKHMEYERKRSLMLSDIAHDLKTPITTISGYAQALRDDVVEDEQKKKK